MSADIDRLYERLDARDAAPTEAETRETETGSAALGAAPETRGPVRGRPFEKGNARRFPRGVSGNPSGGNRSIVTQIQRHCGRDFGKLVQALVLLAWGRDDEVVAFFGRKIRISTTQRVLAIEQLLDRGLGKPKVLLDAKVQQAPPRADPREKLRRLLDNLATGPERRERLLASAIRPRVVVAEVVEGAR
jgi:hypothetical protein